MVWFISSVGLKYSNLQVLDFFYVVVVEQSCGASTGFIKHAEVPGVLGKEAILQLVDTVQTSVLHLPR